MNINFTDEQLAKWNQCFSLASMGICETEEDWKDIITELVNNAFEEELFAITGEQ